MTNKPKAEIIKRPIERMSSNIKKTAWTQAAESCITLLLGILFIIWPDFMMQAVAYIIGALLIIKGCFDILTYFMDKRNIYSNFLLSGVVSALIGVAALVAGPNIANVFRIIIGIFLIYEALSKLNSALKLYYAKIELWKLVVILALIILVFGIFVLFNDTAAVIGWALVISGLISIISDIMFIGQVDKVTAAINGQIDNLSKKASSSSKSTKK